MQEKSCSLFLQSLVEFQVPNPGRLGDVQTYYMVCGVVVNAKSLHPTFHIRLDRGACLIVHIVDGKGVLGTGTESVFGG